MNRGLQRIGQTLSTLAMAGVLVTGFAGCSNSDRSDATSASQGAAARSPNSGGGATPASPRAANVKPPTETPNRASEPPPPGTQYAIGLRGLQCVELAESTGLPDLDRDFTIESWVRLPVGTKGTAQLAGTERQENPLGAPAATPSIGGWMLRANLTAEWEQVDLKSALELELALATKTDGWLSVKTGPIEFDDQWRHVAACRSDDEVRLYVDGKLAARKNIDVDLAATENPISLGVARGSVFPQFVSVEVAAFHIASTARYRQEFHRQAPLQADMDTIALLDFRTGEGTDASGRGHNGQFYGPTWVKLDPYNVPVVEGESGPLAPPPPGVDLRKALIALRHNEHEEFRKIMRQCRSILPKIEPTPAGEPVPWTTLTLNEGGEQFAAVRFTSPLEAPADLRWCLVFPANILQQWSIMGLEEESSGLTREFEEFVPEYFVEFEDLEEPEANCAVFQRTDGGKIEPFREYTLWFAFAAANPVPMSIAMRVLPASPRREEPLTSAAIARDLGLALPLRFKQPETAEEFAARASAAGFLEPAVGVTWIEKGLQKWPGDRGLLRVAISLHERRGYELMDAGEIPLAAPYFSKAGQYAQTFEKEFADPTGEERHLIATALYNQACSQALAGENDDAMASLRGALRLGFADLKLLESDPDLETLRDRAEFTHLVNNLRSLVYPSATLDYALQVHPDDAVEFSGHWYKFYPSSLPWHLAQFRCKQEGGYLTCVESAEESEFVAKLSPEGHVWLGAYGESSGVWRWINGQPFTAIHWAPNEPKKPGKVAFSLDPEVIHQIADGDFGKEADLRLKAGPEGPWFAVPIAEQSIRGYLCEWER